MFFSIYRLKRLTHRPLVIKLIFMKRWYLLTGLLTAFFLFFSCNAEIEINLDVDSSGEADLSVNLDPVLTQYIFDLQSVFTNVSPEEAEHLFQPEKTKVLLEKSNTVSVLSMDSTDINWIKMKLGFDPLEKVLDEGNRLLEGEVQESIRRVMDMTVAPNGVKKVTFQLDKDNFEHLVAVIPPEAQPLVATFGPPGFEVDPEEYIEVLKLTFIEYDSDHIDTAIRESQLRLKVNFAGELLSYSGGTVEGNSLIVTVPLLDLLVLNEPFVFEVEFK